MLIIPLVAYPQSDEEALFLRRIADFWQEGEYSLAKTQIEEFLTEYPESIYSDALTAALGDLYLREKNFSAALQSYAQVKTEEFLSRVFLKRMQCLYEMQWYATLADECEAHLQQGPDLHATYFLAIALYHQCLNASKEPETLQKLAERAKPHFELLSKSELSEEVAQGFAHLCCILKEYEKASQIYQVLAEKHPENREEMLFQVALIQSEYDKAKAIETFEKIAKMGQKRAKEAAYNKLILSFDTGHFEDLAQRDLLKEIPKERASVARLFLGRSLIHLKKYKEAVTELKTALEEEQFSTETLRAVLVSLMEAAYQSNDLASLDLAIEKLSASFPNDSEIPKGYFSRAQILKIRGESEKAEKQFEEILAQFPDSTQKPQILFELAHLDYKGERWEKCALRSRDFLSKFPQHELASFAWRYLVSSSAELASKNPSSPQLVADLEEFLKQPLSESEKGGWRLLLAKTYYELNQFDKAISLLEKEGSPNGKLLYALCLRDGQKDLKQFVLLAEEALAEKADLIREGSLHTALFNALIELKEEERAAQHLFAAFEAKEPIKSENLLWLANLYFNRLQNEETNFTLAEKTAALLQCTLLMIQESVLPASDSHEICDPSASINLPGLSASTTASPDPNFGRLLGIPQSLNHSQCKAALHPDRLAKVYTLLGRLDEAIALLESTPTLSEEGKLLLAESYAKKGGVEKALQMFDAIVASCSTVRTPLAASASLQGARLKLKKGETEQVAIQLKNLVLQKNLANEPLHLEAALDYVELQAHSDLEKKLSLLKKTKSDFERKDDLLSKDYHEARTKWPAKDRIYQKYMQFLEAEILAVEAEIDPKHQKDLQAKSKDLLLQIINEPTALALRERAMTLLNSIE
jgi:outer membrane protein assembly factor BamD (BamD/ComL family)